MRVPTLGIEEEFLLADAGSGAPRSDAEHVLERVPEDGAEHELRTAQVETGSAPCGDLDAVAADLRGRRAQIAAAAEQLGAVVLASATHPTADPQEVPFTQDRRYRLMEQEFGLLAAEALVGGCHVHVAVPDREAAVAVVDRVQPWLPVLLAVSANSPLWRGRDTGHASWRAQIWSRWPTAGATSPFGSAAAYDARCDALVATGAAVDRAALYFDARPSERWPTVEVRVADVGLEVDDAVLLGGLVRALVMSALAARELPAPDVPFELLRAAGWRASRTGLAGQLVDPYRRTLRPAHEVLGALRVHVADALDETGDADHVDAQLDRLRRDGTGADRQRAALESGGLQALIRRVTLVA